MLVTWLTRPSLSLLLALALAAHMACEEPERSAPSPDAGGGVDDPGPAEVLPTGRYQVGTTYYEVIDRQRPEPFTDAPHDHRTLVVRAFYPADRTTTDVPAPYFLNAQEAGLNAQLLGLPANALDGLATHAFLDAPVAAGGGSFPVIIFSPGLNMPAAFYTYQLEDLASHGYAVFAISHPHATGAVVFADGRVALPSEAAIAVERRDELFATWSADQRFVLGSVEALGGPASSHQLRGRLDTRRVGVFGHSFGGGAAAQTCLEDPWFRACADLDGSVGKVALAGSIAQPFLLLRAADNGDESTLVPFFAGLGGVAYRVRLAGAQHNSFSDLGAVARALAQKGIAVDPSSLLLGTLSPERAFHLGGKHLIAFFDAHLGGKSTLLDQPPTDPEITIERRAAVQKRR